MNWGEILSSGVVSAVVGAVSGGVVGGLVSLAVARSTQSREHKYQDEIRKQEKEEAQKEHLQLIVLNRTQKEVLEFCREHPSERYSLRSSDGTCWLVSSCPDEQMEFPDMTIGDQIRTMVAKGYAEELSDLEGYYLFELTDQGKNLPLDLEM